MTERWIDLPREEQVLLNPGFCSRLLWHAATGHRSIAGNGISFDESFLVLPLVLHRATRESLPATVATSLAAWIVDHPLTPPLVADRAQMLVRVTREAMLFGGSRALFKFERGFILPDSQWKGVIKKDLKTATYEVRACAKRAEFVGKWFARAGSGSSVMTLFGVRP